MLDGLVGLGLWGAGAILVRRWGWAWGVVGVWLNLLWFIYQNELGQGWLFYMRGVGLALALGGAFGGADALALLSRLGRRADAGGGVLLAGGAF